MDYESMTVPQLKDIARSNNLKNWSRLKKADTHPVPHRQCAANRAVLGLFPREEGHAHIDPHSNAHTDQK